METIKNWHALKATKIAENISANLEKGLNEKEVDERKEKYGLNILTKKKTISPLMRFLLQFHQPLIYALLAAAVITFILHEYIDSAVIFGVVIVNAIVGYIQEAKAVDSLAALAKTMITRAKVLRNGGEKKISSEDLVPGDIVIFESGDKVSADIRLFQTKELKSNESALTGESLPVEKSIAELAENTPLADRKNMLYASTLITNGIGRGIVIATGDKTEIGKISQLVENADNIETPLTQKLAHFSNLLLYIIMFFTAVTFFVSTVIYKNPPLDAFMAAVAIAVGAIPEGLPAAITIILSIGVARMAKRKAIIRKLPAVETLGSTTIICSDKTGTLTENKMTVQTLFAGNAFYSVTGQGFSRSGEIIDELTKKTADFRANAPLNEILSGGLLCNDSKIAEKDGTYYVEGDPTEGALIVSGEKAKIRINDLEKLYPRIDGLPFESEKQYMATLHKDMNKSANVIYIKGSTESILKRCSHFMGNDGIVKAINKEEITKIAERSAALGLRVIAFAKKDMPAAHSVIEHKDVDQNLVFLGFQAMMDPPREEAIRAIRSCHGAGVLVKMITGDHASTAKAIAQKMGIKASLTDDKLELIAVTGSQMESWTDEDYLANTLKTTVFARVTPEQKLKIIKSLQEQGHIAAMTGDGVNDAPALKQANIGVAMGRDGTEVAKEAADLVLTDDNFATIQAAVEEGRGVFDNLRKFIVWTIPTNLTEGMILVIAIIFNFALPISPLQILWINMMTALLLGMTLAFEPKEDGIMLRKPNDPKMPIFDTILTQRTLYVSALLIAIILFLFRQEKLSSGDVIIAQTLASNMLVFGELFYLFNCRSFDKSPFKIGFFSNKIVLAGVLLMISVQMLFTYSPIMNTLFGTAPLSLEAWGKIIIGGLIVYTVVEIEKMIRKAR